MQHAFPEPFREIGGATAPGFPTARRVTGGSAEERSDEGEAPARKGGAAQSADYLDRRGMLGKQAGRKS